MAFFFIVYYNLYNSRRITFLGGSYDRWPARNTYRKYKYKYKSWWQLRETIFLLPKLLVNVVVLVKTVAYLTARISATSSNASRLLACRCLRCLRRILPPINWPLLSRHYTKHVSLVH